VQFPTWIKPAVLGCVFGTIGVLTVAFKADLIVTADTASTMAEHEADSAVVASLTPICVAQYKGSGTPTLLASLEKQRSWERVDFVEEHGWATMPGSKTPNKDVANACAHELMKLKKS